MSLRRWLVRGDEPDAERVRLLAQALDVTTVTAQVMILRGVADTVTGREYLRGQLASLPDPFLLPGMERAVARLSGALAAGERIAVHGDYDVDGISGTALLVEVLRELGGEVSYHIPLRLKDGYGLSADALRQAASAGARVVVSVDCGVSAVSEALLAAELGIDLIITDHHQPPDPLPTAYAIVNPHLAGSRFPCAELAGVGVAFFLMAALRKRLREEGSFRSRPEPDLRRSLDLVALGTIADVVPLLGVNRTLTRAGLKIMNEATRPGLEALREVAAVGEIGCGSVAFRLAPRLNAAGRLEDAALGVELLLSTSGNRSQAVARLLDDFNRERQALEQETLAQALSRLDEGVGQGGRSIVLADARWHPGVIGIVASRLVERFHRPTVLVAMEGGQGKGSARSIGGFHLYQALSSCRRHLLGFGGHAFAAGLTIAEGEVESFAAAFEAVANATLSDADLQPRLLHDGELLLEELTAAAVHELAALAPFGAGNPEPAFLVRDARAQQLQTVGGSHLRFTLRQGGYTLPCIAFGMAERQEGLAGALDLLVTPTLNEWRGKVTVQLRVKDWRNAECPA